MLYPWTECCDSHSIWYVLVNDSYRTRAYVTFWLNWNLSGMTEHSEATMNYPGRYQFWFQPPTVICYALATVSIDCRIWKRNLRHCVVVVCSLCMSRYSWTKSCLLPRLVPSFFHGFGKSRTHLELIDYSDASTRAPTLEPQALLLLQCVL